MTWRFKGAMTFKDGDSSQTTGSVDEDGAWSLDDVTVTTFDATTLKKGGATVTATAAELNLLDNVVASISWSVAAGASNICILTGTIKDAAGSTVAASRPLVVYLSEAATGIGVSADSYSTGASITTGTQLVALTANKAWLINTHTDGTFAVSITDTNTPANQYAVALATTTGQLSISEASGTNWGA